MELLFVNCAIYFKGLASITYVYANFFLGYAAFIGLTVGYFIEALERNKFLLQRRVEYEQNRTEKILKEIIPSSIYERVKNGEVQIADLSHSVTILFCDIVGFTEMASKQSASQIVSMLNDLFSRLDEIAAFHGVEKIKTIGDAYMAAAGIGDAVQKDAYAIADFALASKMVTEQMSDEYPWPICMRFGIATGEVISGVIGSSRPTFDTWGRTVNLASRLERSSPPGMICLDQATAEFLMNSYEISAYGRIALKGIGDTEAFLLHGANPLVAGNSEPDQALAPPSSEASFDRRPYQD
ncbi:hypothetical protein GCM10008965_34660 [Methylorubrum aminovorans]|nr:hypothetical protein GCM10025880_63650 [Methylorubrum aminovorans]